MLISGSAKTNWFHVLLLVGITAVAVFYIQQALAKPFVEWQTYNQVRASELKK
ncbi:MAG TPA: hypothetical protein VJG65_00770 [Patescibacteria group bacterium]|nr:hypothetical protein [Patescibacteria group bacterium]